MVDSERDNANQYRVYDPSGISPTLNSMGGGGRMPFIIDPQGRNKKVTAKTAAPTLRAEAHGNAPCVLTDKYGGVISGRNYPRREGVPENESQERK